MGEGSYIKTYFQYGLVGKQSTCRQCKSCLKQSKSLDIAQSIIQVI